MKAKAGVNTKAVILETVEPHYKVFRLEGGKMVSAFQKHEKRIDYEKGYIYTKGDDDEYGVMLFNDYDIALAYLNRCPGIAKGKATFVLCAVFPIGEIARDYTLGTPNDCYTTGAILVGDILAKAVPKPVEEWRDVTNEITFNLGPFGKTGHKCAIGTHKGTLLFYLGANGLNVPPRSDYKVEQNKEYCISGSFQVFQKV